MSGAGSFGRAGHSAMRHEVALVRTLNNEGAEQQKSCPMFLAGNAEKSKPAEWEAVKELVIEVLSNLREAGPSNVSLDGIASGKETENRVSRS